MQPSVGFPWCWVRAVDPPRLAARFSLDGRMLIGWIVLFSILIWITWLAGRGNGIVGYMFALLLAGAAAYFTIESGFRDEAPLALAAAVGLTTVSYVRDRL